MINIIKQKILNVLSDKKFSEILTDSALVLVATVLVALFEMITSVIIAKYYGANALGTVAVINSFLLFAAIFALLGTDTSILRLIPEHVAQFSYDSAFRVYRKTQYFVACMSIVAGLLLFFGSGILSTRIFSKPHLRSLFAMAAAFVIFQALMQLYTQSLRGLRLIKEFALMLLLPHFCKIAVLIILTVLCFHQNNPVYALFISCAIAAVAGAWMMDKMFKKKGRQDVVADSMPLNKILTISLPMLMTATMSLVIGQTGVLVLGIFRPENDVGYFSAGARMAHLTSYIPASVNSVVAPKFSELFHIGQVDELFRVAQKATKLIFWATAPMILCFLMFGKVIIEFLFSRDFVVAYWPMSILVMGYFFAAISGSTNVFMNMTGSQKAFRNIILIAAILNVVLNLVLTPRMGANGAAIAGTTCLIFWNLATLAFMKAKYGKTTGYLPLCK